MWKHFLSFNHSERERLSALGGDDSALARPTERSTTIARLKTFKSTEAFEKDLSALLLSLASSCKGGIDPLAALLDAAQLFQKGSIMRAELERVSQVIDRGGSEKEAIVAFGSGVIHPDIALFHEAFILSREHGAPLREALQRLTKVLRQRQSFRRKGKGAVAMQRLSSFGIVACACATLLLQLVAHPDTIRTTMVTPLGIFLLSGGAFLMAIGFIWMMIITRVKI